MSKIVPLPLSWRNRGISAEEPRGCSDPAAREAHGSVSAHSFASDTYRSVFEAISEPITLLDLEGLVILANSAADRVTKNQGCLVGRTWIDILPEGFSRHAQNALAKARVGTAAHFTVKQTLGRRLVLWWDLLVAPAYDQKRNITGTVVMARDVTHEKSNEERVRWAANHDELTKLANRTLFNEELRKLISRGAPFGIVLLDVDDFKRINDTWGHGAGDVLLQAFGDRLRRSSKEGDIIARVGGDEFAVLLPSLHTEDELQEAIDAISTHLGAPCHHEGQALDCYGSIGASLYPTMAFNGSDPMKAADVALYAAKNAGGNTARIFQPFMEEELQSRLSMLSLAREAISAELIVPYYQPKVDLHTGRLEGFEALLRWQHPRDGVQPPKTIAAAFDDSVLASAISDRMIDLVIADARRWLNNGTEFGHVAVNAGPADFRKAGFAESLLQRLDAASIPTARFQLEVTESVFFGRGAESVQQSLRTLSNAGMAIALDDFGTGFASLTHLKQFPLDVIKIDRSFIRDLHEDPEDEAIVRAVIGLGKSFKLKVVAEGVETPAQSAYLRKYRCDFGQGYLFSPASPASEVPSIIVGQTERAERLRQSFGVALRLDRGQASRQGR